MSKIVITGATGFLGRALLAKLYNPNGPRIVCVARGEEGLLEIARDWPMIDIAPGDVGDRRFCERVLSSAQACFHLAAMKHIGMSEDNPSACIKSNVVGTYNLLHAFQGHTFVAVSTDKAAQVSGVYGATKFLMENLINEYAKIFTDIEYRYVRYGNVLYSTGSVLCKWKQQLQAGQDITITDPRATRFFWTVDQAIDHIFEAIEKGKPGVPYIPKMKACSMWMLRDAMRRKYLDPDKRSNTIDIGLQPGENLHETMDGQTFSNQVEQYTMEELMELI